MQRIWYNKIKSVSGVCGETTAENTWMMRQNEVIGLKKYSARKLILMAADVVILFLCLALTSFFFSILEMPVMRVSRLLPYMALNIFFTFLTLKISGAYDVFWR